MGTTSTRTTPSTSLPLLGRDRARMERRLPTRELAPIGANQSHGRLERFTHDSRHLPMPVLDHPVALLLPNSAKTTHHDVNTSLCLAMMTDKCMYSRHCLMQPGDMKQNQSTSLTTVLVT